MRTRALLLALAAGFAAVVWKEFPALVRYFKIERM
ncbi:DUF6893 family small protein [Amycolatopsis sp.]